MRRFLRSFVCATALAASLAASQPPARTQPGQAVFILAARDSRLLTLCPAATEVKSANGSHWESDRPLIVSDGPYGLQTIYLLETHATLHMPAPGGRPALPGGATLTRGTELDRDRISPDPAVRKWLEQEFAKQKTYTLVDSAEAAELVLVAESFWRPLIARSGSGRLDMVTTGDYEANLLQGILAFAVPAAVYRDHPGDVSAWLAERTWEGSFFYHTPTRQNGYKFASASPQEVVRAFAKRSKPANDHPPICAASNHPFSLEGVDARGFAVQPAAAAERESELGATFKSEVTYVSVPVRVTDAEGKVVDHLVASDFVVREDGADQKIDRLLPLDEPFDIAVVIDTSASMRLQLEDVQNAVLAFIDTLRPADRVMPVSFNDRITAHSDFLSDHSRLRLALFQVGKGEGTRLWDALDLVMRDRLDRLSAASRRAIVVFTDGVDTRSRLANAATAMGRLAESQVPVYVVQFDTRGQQRPTVMARPQDSDMRTDAAPRGAFDTVPYAEANANLQVLADTTGGRLFRASTLSTATDAFADVAHELKGQYTLCYYPTNPARDGRERRITVTMSRTDVTVRARPSYWVTR